MKYFCFLVIICALQSCNNGNFNIDATSPKFIRKSISDKNIIIKWYYHGFITSDSPDKVEVYKDTSKREIIEATWTIVDVSLQNDTIKLKLFNPSSEKIDFKLQKNNVFGYKVILDSTGTYEELSHIPIGNKE